MEPGNNTDMPAGESEELTVEQERQLRSAVLANCENACQEGDLEKLRELFSPRKHDDSFVSCLLDWTFEGDNIEAARCILDQGVDLNRMHLRWIAQHCRSVAMLELLAEYGMKFHCRNTTQPDNILLDNNNRLISTWKVDWLVDRGIDINLGSDIGMSPHRKGDWWRDNTVAVLNAAAELGDIDLFDHLVSLGAKPDQSNAMCHAAKSRKGASMIPHLVEKYHLDVNADDKRGGLNNLPPWNVTEKFPLRYAASSHNLAGVEALLKCGAKDDDAYRSLKKWCNRDEKFLDPECTSILKLLLDAGANSSEVLGWAIEHDFYEGAKICLEYGAYGDIATSELYSQDWASDDHGMSDRKRNMLNMLDEWKFKQENKEALESFFLTD